MVYVIEMKCTIVSKMVVCKEVYDDKEELEKNFEHMRKLISNRIKTISDEDLNNLPIEVLPLFF